MEPYLFCTQNVQEQEIYDINDINDIIDINDPIIAPKCLQYYANILFSQNDFQQSIDIITQLIDRKEFKKYHTNKDNVYYLMSRCYSKLMKFDEALQYLEKANQINPN
eukprot:132167_1